MKKQWIMWVAVVVVVIAVIGVIAISRKNGGTTATEINMKKMFDTIYADLKDQLPDSLTTQEINVKDGEQVAEYTGLVSTENVEKLLVSEPMISSQAYSAVALKVKAGADIEGIKQEIYHITSGDIITIEPKITEFNGVRMTVTYNVIDKKTENIVINAWTKHCFTDKTLRPINIKKRNEKIYTIFEKLLEEGIKNNK